MKKIFDLFLAYGIAVAVVSLLSNFILPIIYGINGYVLIAVFIIVGVTLTRSLYIFCRKNTNFPNKKNVISFVLFPLYVAFILYGIIKSCLLLMAIFSPINGFTYMYIIVGLDFIMAASFTVIMSIVLGLYFFIYIRLKSTILQILVSGIVTILLIYGTFYIIQSENNIFIENEQSESLGDSKEYIER